MEPLGLTVLDWGLVALVVFPLVQLPLVFYLARYVDSEERVLDHAVEFRSIDTDADARDASTGPEPERALDRFESPHSRSTRTTDRISSTSSTVACLACGTENDPAFTFCRVCVARLSTSHSVASTTPPY